MFNRNILFWFIKWEVVMEKIIQWIENFFKNDTPSYLKGKN